jgi:ligand-binding sensor domain-containing protein
MVSTLLYVNVNAQVSFTNYTTADGLADDFVDGGVCVDQNNVVWFGTQNGVSKFDGTTWTTFTTVDGLIDDYVTCIAYDNANNKIWIGTNSGISVFDGTAFTNYSTADGLVDNSTMFISVDDNGTAWVATFSGLSKVDNGVITNYSSTDGLSSTLLTNVVTKGTKVYIGSLNVGLIIYDGTTFQTIGTTEGLLDNYVSSIEIDNSDNIYIGSYAGLTVLNSSLSVTDTYTLDSELFNNYVQDIVVDDDGNLVILEYADYLSDGGVTVFDGIEWNLYVMSNGLVDKMVKEAELDIDGNIWITTGSGVSKMSLGTGIGNSKVYAEATVYPNPACNYFSIDNIDGLYSYKISDISGRIVFAGSEVESNYIDIRTLPKAVYFLTYEQNGRLYSAKIFVE